MNTLYGHRDIPSLRREVQAASQEGQMAGLWTERPIKNALDEVDDAITRAPLEGPIKQELRNAKVALLLALTACRDAK